MLRKRFGTSLSIVAVIAVCAVMQMTAGAARAAIIRLKSKATVNSGVVVLADVADVFDRNSQTASALRSVTLLPTPAAGSEIQISFSMIRSRLQARGFNLANLEFTGNSSVSVSAPPNRRERRAADRKSSIRTGPPATSWQVTRAKHLLSQAILNYLRTARLGEVDIEVKLDSALAPLVVSGQTAGYEIRGGRPPWDAWQTLTVRFIDRKEQLQTIRVQARTLIRPLIPIAQRSLPKGYLIRKHDIGLKRADAATGIHATVDDIIGRETKRAIRQGQLVGVDDVREVPLIRRGDVVTALARIGGITVRQDMQARNDGALGNRVTLRTLDGGDELEATVTGYHEATVLGVGSVQSARQAGRGVSFALHNEVAAPRATAVRLVGRQADRRPPLLRTTAAANTSTRLAVPTPVGSANQPSRSTTDTDLPYRNRRYR